MQLSDVRLSVRPSVSLFVRRTSLLQVCCSAPGMQEISIDCSTALSSTARSSASEVTTLWRYRKLFIIIIISNVDSAALIVDARS